MVRLNSLVQKSGKRKAFLNENKFIESRVIMHKYELQSKLQNC